MKRKGFRLTVLLLLISTMLCGCQTALYEMTEEEENIIVRYAAYVLAKHNIYQKDGMVVVNPELLEPEEKDSEIPIDTPEETETENDSEDVQQENSSQDIAEAPQNQPENSVSLAEAVGYDGQLQITYTGFLVTDNYMERIIFNVFKDNDREIYENILGLN